MFEIDEPLSAQGGKRREAILRLAQQHAARRRRARRAVRVGGAVLVAVIVGVLMWGRRPVRPTWVVRSGELPATVIAPEGIVSPIGGPTVHWIETDHAITDRLAIRAGRPTWQVIDDDQLLRSLVDAGRPSSLIYYDGRSYLLPR